MQNIKSARHQISSLQWKRCFARVSFGINSATSNLSSPSQQQPIRLASRSFRSCPTILASSCIQPKPRSQTKFPKKKSTIQQQKSPPDRELPRIALNQAKPRGWTASPRSSGHLPTPLCRRRSGPSLRAPRRCSLMQIQTSQHGAAQSCTRQSPAKPPCHLSLHSLQKQ